MTTIDLSPMADTLISVVMPVYNAQKFLAEAIESILHQTYPHFEFIIINDGSTDESTDIIQQYAQQDKRIFVISQENRGIAEALNNGIRNSKGQYIARMDADDISLQERLITQLSFLEKHPNIDVLGCDFLIIDKHGKTTQKVTTAKTPQDIAITLCTQIPFTHSTVMMRRQIFERFAYENTPCEDYWLFAQCFHQGNFANSNQTLFKYRQDYGHSLSDTKRLEMRTYNKTVGRYFFNKNQAYLKKIINSKHLSKHFIDVLAVMFAHGYIKFSLFYLSKTPKYWVSFSFLTVRYRLATMMYYLKYNKKYYALYRLVNFIKKILMINKT